MNTSETINEIATALNKAQSEMTGAKKGAKNPFFKSNYSDLSMVIEAISEPFSNNGLSFIQAAEMNDTKVSVTTRIMHNSGQYIESVTELPPTKPDAQGVGSAISYAKRYGLQALAGVPSVDDDGNDAVKHVAKPMSLAEAKRILGDTADNVFAHYNNGDQLGMKEIMDEMKPKEKIALKRIYTHQDNNIFDEIMKVYNGE